MSPNISLDILRETHKELTKFLTLEGEKLIEQKNEFKEKLKERIYLIKNGFEDTKEKEKLIYHLMECLLEEQEEFKDKSLLNIIFKKENESFRKKKINLLIRRAIESLLIFTGHYAKELERTKVEIIKKIFIDE